MAKSIQSRVDRFNGVDRSGPKLVFTDCDGTQYFRDRRGDIVDKHGFLVSLECERNIRIAMNESVGTLEYGA